MLIFCSIPRVIQSLASGNVGASDLQQAQPFAKQSMCKHMLDAANCKDEDADDANCQTLNHPGYTLSAQNVEGFWKRISSKTGNTQCVISIYKHQNKYYGRIIGTFDAEGRMKENLYTPEDRAEKVMGSPYYCGMDLLWDLQEDGTKYRGKIVDPTTGKIYSAAIWNKDGNLIVRGELFCFGRNEVWYPLEEGDFPKDFKVPDLTQFIPVVLGKSL